jgi:hypothetical protein
MKRTTPLYWDRDKPTSGLEPLTLDFEDAAALVAR